MYLKEDVVKIKIISDEASAYCINLNVKENLKYIYISLPFKRFILFIDDFFVVYKGSIYQ